MRKETVVHLARRTRENILLYPISSGVTLASLSLCLLLAGMSLFFYRAATATLLPLWVTEPKAVVYLHSEVSQKELEDLAKELRKWPKILEIRTVSKDEALKRLEAQLGTWKGILDGIGENPLPPSLEISFRVSERHPEETDALIDKIREFPQVEDIFYGKSSAEKLEFIPTLTRLAGSWIPGLLALAFVLIVSNSIKHTVSARREELKVYEMVGATAFFARGPFYLEGIFHGITSGFIASGVLALLTSTAAKSVPPPLAAVFSREPWEMLCLSALILLGAVGLSWLGSWYALKRAG